MDCKYSFKRNVDPEEISSLVKQLKDDNYQVTVHKNQYRTVVIGEKSEK